MGFFAKLNPWTRKAFMALFLSILFMGLSVASLFVVLADKSFTITAIIFGSLWAAYLGATFVLAFIAWGAIMPETEKAEYERLKEKFEGAR